MYIGAQVIGSAVAAWTLYIIANGRAGFDLAAGFASNGYALHSPGGYSLAACAVAETVLTFMFTLIILGATDRRAPQGFAPIAIGLALTVVHLVGIPVTNLSGKSSREYGSGADGWRMGAAAVMVVLAGPYLRCCPSRVIPIRRWQMRQ